MFISYTRSLERVLLTKKDLEALAFHYSLTGSEYCLNLLSNLTYFGKEDSKTYDTWNNIISAMTGVEVEHSNTYHF